MCRHDVVIHHRSVVRRHDNTLHIVPPCPDVRRHVIRRPLELSDPVLGTRISARAEPPRRIFYVQESLPADHDRYVHDGRLQIRALHVERDTTHRRFTHVDGKFELYPAAEWGPSRMAPMTPLPHRVANRKLWRVDAPEGMLDRIWAELVSGFFRRNELVTEHFAALGAQPVGV